MVGSRRTPRDVRPQRRPARAPTAECVLTARDMDPSIAPMADLTDDIRIVLGEAAKGKGPEPHFVTAHQILDRLPRQRREELVATYGGFGRGAGTNFGAASALADALKSMADVETSYLDTKGVSFGVEGAIVAAGYAVVGIDRLRRA